VSKLPPPVGQVLGNAGSSLDDFGSWGTGDAGAARVGKTGEIKTAAFLNALCLKAGGPTVLHDLNIPLPRVTANIDHVLVSGRNVLLIDSKVWKPGFYWTLGGTNRRGFEAVPHTGKQTMIMAERAIRGLLGNAGIDATMVRPILVIWPSSRKSTINTAFLKVPGANVIHADKIGSRKGVNGFLKRFGSDTANPDVVAALAKLLN
jgi:hypothetical protein